MTAPDGVQLDERPAVPLVCVKADGGYPCGGRPIVRYAIGPVCSGHLLAGAQVYEWLADDAVTAVGATGWPAPPAPGVLGTVGALVGPQLPNPGRAVAAQHADAAPGEATAARLVAYKAGKTRALILEHLTACGARGTTAIEAWRWFQATHSPTTERYTVAPRLSEMVTDGWAVKTGAVRNVRGPGYPPEEVYVLSARGRREKGVTW